MNKMQKKAAKKHQQDKEQVLRKPKKQREEALDEASRESFPASDPPGWTH